MPQRSSPDAAPPPYSLQRFMPGRTRRANLRNTVIVITFFSSIWSVIIGASYIRKRNRDALPATLQLIYIILAILYFVCTAIEVFGIFAAYRASIPLVRSYFWMTTLAAIIVSGSEVVRTVTHFTMKDSIITSCIDSYSTDVKNGVYSSAAVDSACRDDWSNATWIDIALLIFTFLLSFLFASIAASYLFQLKHPETLRTHVAQAASSQYAYPLRPFESNTSGAMPPPMYPEGQQPLPSYDNPYGVETGEDQKFAAPPPAAHVHTGPYAPPPGPPPGHAAAAAANPFEDQVEHAPQQLGRRPGESADDFELRQHQHDLEQERRARGGAAGGGFYHSEADRDAFASTETVTLEPRDGYRV